MSLPNTNPIESSDALAAALLNRLEGALILLDGQDRVIHFNHAALSLFGDLAVGNKMNHLMEGVKIYLPDQRTPVVPSFLSMAGDRREKLPARWEFFWVGPRQTEGEPILVLADRFSSKELPEGTLLLITKWSELRPIIRAPGLKQMEIRASVEKAMTAAFCSQVAHDINNALGVIKGFAETLQDFLESGKQVPLRIASAILNGADRLENLSGAIRKRGAILGERKQINLNEMLRDTITKHFNPILTLANIRLNVQLADTLPHFKADEEKLASLLLSFFHLTLANCEVIEPLGPHHLWLKTEAGPDNSITLIYEDDCSEKSLQDGLEQLSIFPVIHRIALSHQASLLAEIRPPHGIKFSVHFPGNPRA